MNAVRKLVLAAALLAMSLSAAAAVRTAPEGITADNSRAVVRRGAEVLHPVRVDRAWLDAATRLGSAWLPSTGASPLLARFSRTFHDQDGNMTWVGKVDTRLGEQSALLTVGDHAVFGFIPQQNGLPLRIETRHGQTWLVEGAASAKVAPEGLSDGLIPTHLSPAPAAMTSSSIDVTASTVSPLVDVLVIYTPSVVTYYGSDSAAQTRIAYLQSFANQAYVDSQAGIQIRVVAKKNYNYTAATDNNTLLDLITNTSTDPFKLQVDSWRTTYGADLVIVVRAFNNTTQTNCGLAWIGGYHGSAFSKDYGFATVGDGSNGGFYCPDPSFAHELGHNMGCHHDTATSSGDYGAYTYSRGYRKTIDSNTGFATVMAYSVSPQSLLGIFSNPRLNSCMGQPCGVANSADNAKGLTTAAPSVAAFLATKVAVLPSLTIGDVTLTEGNSGTKLMTFTLKLSAASASTVTYNIGTASGTASAGSDYAANVLTGQSIPAGTTSKTFAVTIYGDTTVESNQAFTVIVSNIVNAYAADGYATGTILNDDGPTLSIADLAIAEGNSGTKLATFTVKLSAASAAPVTYNITTANATAIANTDYVKNTLTGQSIAAGTTSKTFAVTINGDATVEANETFTVTATSVVGATVFDGVAVGTILNDDGPTLSIADVAVTEGNSGSKLMTFTVRLSQVSASPVTYSIATANGTAAAGSDYVASSLTGQSIAAGLTSKTFSVTINGDTAIEPNETFYVNLGSAVGATIFDGRANGTISNDD